MAASKKSSDYFGLSWLVSLVLAIIPVTSMICGVATRFLEGKIVAAIVRIVLGWNIIYIADIVLMFLNGRILRVLDI